MCGQKFGDAVDPQAVVSISNEAVIQWYVTIFDGRQDISNLCKGVTFDAVN